jgi:hypothetical protein
MNIIPNMEYILRILIYILQNLGSVMEFVITRIYLMNVYKVKLEREGRLN